jgi:hypothetical protein
MSVYRGRAQGAFKSNSKSNCNCNGKSNSNGGVVAGKGSGGVLGRAVWQVLRLRLSQKRERLRSG